MGLFKTLKGSATSNTTSNESPFQQSTQPSTSAEFKAISVPPPYPPPPGPPPSLNPPPYHDWQSFTPDTSLLPPPPPFSATHPNLSSTHNASYDAAAAGHEFCRLNPPFTPSMPASKVHAAAQAGRIGLVAANEFLGKVELKATGGGSYGEIWHIKSTKRCPDANLISTLPMYFAARDSPLRTEIPKTIYYEVRILSMRGEESVIAVGFAGKPYPGWRLPGWHRGSIGAHGDDGRRFVNDSWGGIDFVGRFREGETVGIGIRFSVSENQEVSRRELCLGEAFFTRDGMVEGRWRMDEERDAERDQGGVEGLLGEGDLYACAGCCGFMEFEVVVERKAWLYRGDGT